MSWIEHHRASEKAAAQAEAALRGSDQSRARTLYAEAADAERQALAALDTSKARTLGISAVSAASLYYKAARFPDAESVALRNVSMTLRQLGSEFRLQSVRCGEASGLVEC